jgi:hypothetical protein
MGRFLSEASVWLVGCFGLKQAYGLLGVFVYGERMACWAFLSEASVWLVGRFGLKRAYGLLGVLL